jgi:hypothetical protein
MRNGAETMLDAGGTQIVQSDKSRGLGKEMFIFVVTDMRPSGTVRSTSVRVPSAHRRALD